MGYRIFRVTQDYSDCPDGITAVMNEHRQNARRQVIVKSRKYDKNYSYNMMEEKFKVTSFLE